MTNNKPDPEIPTKIKIRSINKVKTPTLVHAQRRRCQICEAQFWAWPEHKGFICPGCLSDPIIARNHKEN